MQTYPIVVLPDAMHQAESQTPPLPQFQAQRPFHPGNAPSKPETAVIAVEATVVTLPSIAIALQPQTSFTGLILFLVTMAAIATQLWRQGTTYLNHKQRDRQALDRYASQIRRYRRQQVNHDRELREAHHPERIAAFQCKLILQILAQTIPPDGVNSKARRGASEAEFFEHLNHYFPGKVHVGKTLTIPGFDYPYTPDFAYIDPTSNLHIDIEIDEPYTQLRREYKPLHFLESSRAQRRDRFFLDKGWIVLRFSEEQVVRWPERCCKTISGAIAKIIAETSTLEQFRGIPDLKPMPRWTKAEAQHMKQIKYRQSYWPQHKTRRSKDWRSPCRTA